MEEIQPTSAWDAVGKESLQIWAVGTEPRLAAQM